MQFVDWLFVGLPFVLIVGVALYTRRYVRSVADFMAGGRHAGRYLLANAGSEKLAGAALFVATFEQFSQTGFTIGWWNQILVPVGLFIGITGFVIYRYRQTRALTLAQFFEMRYSRRFRLFAGAVGFVAGIVNFGIIPAVGARFFVYFVGFPVTVHLGGIELPTYLLLMACFLSGSLILTTLGGQITILVTDCVEGMFSQIFYVIIACGVLAVFTWPQIHDVLLAQPAGKSLVNPFDTSGARDFNLTYVLMLAFVNVYGTMAWQNSHAFNSSGATPHDARMGGIVGRWRGFASAVMVAALSLCTLTFLQHPAFHAGAEQVRGIVDAIPNKGTAQQMYWPIALSHILPVGIKGMLCTVLLMGVISGDGMAIHSWGSILIQDVVVPLRKKPLPVGLHLRLLRLAIVGVALFAYAFGAIFQQTDKLLLWWAVTQAIFVGGAGVAIIGGLYWNRGTTAGAWAGMITGSVLSVAGIVLREVPALHFPFNGMQVSFGVTLIAIAVYVTVSLLTCRVPHNMDRLLNRGAYAVEPEDPGKSVKNVSWIVRVVGIDEHFSRSDRWVTWSVFGWSMFWFALFALGSAVYLLHPWSNEAWVGYWRIVNVWLPLGIGVLTTVWFTLGGVHDMRLFFQRLRRETVDLADDGVVGHEGTEATPAKEAVEVH